MTVTLQNPVFFISFWSSWVPRGHGKEMKSGFFFSERFYLLEVINKSSLWQTKRRSRMLASCSLGDIFKLTVPHTICSMLSKCLSDLEQNLFSMLFFFLFNFFLKFQHHKYILPWVPWLNTCHFLIQIWFSFFYPLFSV